jgi:hypothetical protein
MEEEDGDITDPWWDDEESEFSPSNEATMTPRPNFTPRQTMLHCLGAVDATDKFRRFGSCVMPREGWKEDVSKKIKEALEKDPQLASEVFDLRHLEDAGTIKKPSFYPNFARARPLLHWVCYFGMPLELIQYIHELSPSACKIHFSLFTCLSVVDDTSDSSTGIVLPIQEALSCSDGINFETIQFLLEIYPESVTSELMTTMLMKFPLRQSEPLIRRFMPNEDELRRITKSIPSTTWQYPNPLPTDLLEWIAKLHNQSTFSITAEVAYGWNFGICIDDENNGELNVGLQCDENLSFCLQQLSQLPDLKLKSMEISDMDDASADASAIFYFISALTHDPNWVDGPFGAMGADPQTQRPLAQLGMVGLGPPPSDQPPTNNDNAEGSAIESRLDLSSVERLKIDSIIGYGDIMNELLDAIVASLPNLRTLELHGQNNLDEGLPNILPSGFTKLPALANRLVELEIVCHPLAASAVFELLQSSTTLRRLHLLDAYKLGYSLKGNQYYQLSTALSSTQHQLDDAGLQRIDCTSALEELYLDFQIENESLFLETFVRSLETNTNLKRLHLKGLRNAHYDDGASLLDLIRDKKNTTLDEIVVHDLGQTSELEFWCEINHLEPVLETETIELREAIPMLIPYLSVPHDTEEATRIAGRPATRNIGLHSSILYSLIRCRPDLWTPQVD